MKKLFSKELIIGLTVLITLFILVFGINYLKGVNIFKSSNYYYASFTNVTGLAQSAPVKLNGYQVGLVKDISYEYDNPGHVLVEMSLDKELQLPVGTKAEMVSDLLGTGTINLILGNSTTYLESGSKLEGVNATGLMDDIKKDMIPSVTTIIPKVDSLLTNANNLLGNPALSSSIEHLNNVMANLEVSTAKLAQVMNTISPSLQNVSGVMTDAKEISDKLVNISNDLANVTSKISSMPLDSTLSNISIIADNLKEVTDKLNDPSSSLGLLLNDPVLYNNLSSSAAHIDSILIDLKNNPKKYIPKIKIF